MSDTVFYGIFSALSAASIAIAIIAVITIHKTARKATGTQKRVSIAPFHAFLIGFFIAAVLMFYPVYHTEFGDQTTGFALFQKSFLASILNTLQIFFLNGDFKSVSDAVSGILSDGFGTGYTIYSIILHVIAPILTFGFILSFFRESVSMLKYLFRPFTDVYIMSELNESSIALAKDIFKNAPGKKQVIFTDVFAKNDDENFELISEAKRLGAICLTKDVTELWLKRANINRKLFFISRNEDENLRQALTVINRCKNTRYDKYATQFYVFASSVESETLLDAIDHGEMKVRRINERHNLVLHTLCEHSVFANAKEDENGVKHINAAIVGLGTYGTELLKALCWICQMPGYKLTVHVFEYGKGENKIKSIAPELWSHNRDETYGEAYYDLQFHDETDVHSRKFTEELSKLKDLTVAFVTLGTDEQNIETAMKMRMIFSRNIADAAPAEPPVYAVVYSALKNEIVKANGGLKGIPGTKLIDGKETVGYNNDYGITFIGDISTRFSLKIIEQLELEKAGKACHLKWSSTSDDAQRKYDEAKFEKYEYFRKSSISESVHEKYMHELAPEMFDENGNANELAGMYEHNRWNAYMRGAGYVLPEGDPTPKRKNHIAKLHCDLVPHPALDETEKSKDVAVKSQTRRTDK